MGAIKNWMINHSEEISREEGYRLRVQEELWEEKKYQDEITELNTLLTKDADNDYINDLKPILCNSEKLQERKLKSA